MIKVLILFSVMISLTIFSQDHCQINDNQTANHKFSRSEYDVGDIIGIEDQMMEFDICYGDYPTETFSLSDLNYTLNGGQPKVAMIRMNATW